LNNYYKQQLEANNIQPLNEEVWEKQPENPDFYVSLEIPTEIEKETGEFKIVTPITQKIIKCVERPESFEKLAALCFMEN